MFCVSAGRLSNCTHPLVPEHGGFRCDPSPCHGFPHRSSIRFFCEPGFHISNRMAISKCRQGKWVPPIPACIRGTSLKDWKRQILCFMTESKICSSKREQNNPWWVFLQAQIKEELCDWLGISLISAFSLYPNRLHVRNNLRSALNFCIGGVLRASKLAD